MTNTELVAVVTAILLSSQRDPTGDASINSAVEDAFKIIEKVGQQSQEP